MFGNFCRAIGLKSGEMSWHRSIALRILWSIEEVVWCLDHRVGFFNSFKKRAGHMVQTNASADRGYCLCLASLLPLLATSEHCHARAAALAVPATALALAALRCCTGSPRTLPHRPPSCLCACTRALALRCWFGSPAVVR